jgi:hypothetical protein
MVWYNLLNLLSLIILHEYIFSFKVCNAFNFIKKYKRKIYFDEVISWGGCGKVDLGGCCSGIE